MKLVCKDFYDADSAEDFVNNIFLRQGSTLAPITPKQFKEEFGVYPKKFFAKDDVDVTDEEIIERLIERFMLDSNSHTYTVNFIEGSDYFRIDIYEIVPESLKDLKEFYNRHYLKLRLR